MRNDIKTVRSKFECKDVLPGLENKTVIFRAVTSENQGNEDFTSYTPNGSIEILISNTAKAADFFEPGKLYYVDFEPA